MPIEADDAIDIPESEIPDWLKDDDASTESQAPAEGDEASPFQEGDQPESAFDAAQRRDHAGRFTRSEASPTGFVPQDANAQAAQSAQTQETAEQADDTEPFTYRADGRDYQIPGLRVPEAHAEQVRQLLSEGMHHRTTWQQERQAAEAREQQIGQWVQAKQQEFAAATDILRGLFTDREKLAQMYADWEVQGPALMEKARAAGLEAELQMYRSQGDGAIAQQAQEATQTGLWDSMSELIDSRFPNVFDQYDMTAMYGEFAGEGLVQVADRDYPEYGFQKGDILLDESALMGRMAMRAQEAVQRNRTARAAADKVAKVASRNAAALGKARRPPATVGARTATVPEGKTVIQTAKDWQRSLDDDDD